MTTESTVTTEVERELEPPVKVVEMKRSKILRSKDERKGDGAELDDGAPAEKDEGGKIEISKEMQALKNADHLAVREWLESLSAQATIRIAVRRMSPKTFRDPQTGREVNVGGHLKNYEAPITEEDIQREHGGGTFQLEVKTKNRRGQFMYFNARTVEVAGDPKIDDANLPRAFQPPSHPIVQPSGPDQGTQQLMGKMFDHLANQANNAQRIDREPRGAAGQDIANAVSVATAPLQAAIQMMSEQLAQKDAEMRIIRQEATKGDPYKDQLLNNLLQSDNARIAAIRTQHESEIRMLKEAQIANEQRLRDQHDRDMQRLEQMFMRERETLKTSGEIARGALETTQKTTQIVLEAENKRLDKENTELRAELGVLRNKKDPSLKDKLAEMRELKDLVNDGEDDEEEKGTIEKIIEAAGGLPIVSALAHRLENGGAGAAQAAAAAQAANQQVQMQPARPRKLVRNKHTGAVLAPQSDGSLKPVNRVVASDPGDPQAVQVPPVDPAVVKQAVDYMSNAYSSGQKPEEFADSVRPMIPASILAAMRALGIDGFMAKVASLDGTSPLATQGGRNWRRRVANRLLGEHDE